MNAAVVVADRIGVIVDGRLRQLGPPEELLAAPADAFVASFAGANLLRGLATTHLSQLTEVALATGELIYSTDALAGDVDVAVYPWDITLSTGAPTSSSAPNVIHREITSLAAVGGRVRVGLGPLTAELPRAVAAELALAVGATAHVRFEPHATRLLARD